MQHKNCHLLPVTCQLRQQPRPETLPGLLNIPLCTIDWFTKTTIKRKYNNTKSGKKCHEVGQAINYFTRSLQFNLLGCMQKLRAMGPTHINKWT